MSINIAVRSLYAFSLATLLPAATLQGQPAPGKMEVRSIADEASALYQDGRLNDAIAILRRAVVDHPASSQYHFMLANALLRTGDFRGAVVEYDVTLQLSPANFEALLSRGFARFELNQFMEAVDDWSDAVRIEPRDASAHAALAVGLLVIGDLSQGAAQYFAAITLDGGFSTVDRLSSDIRWSPRATAAAQRALTLSLR